LTDAEALRLRSGQSVGLLKLSDRERLGRIRSGDLVCAMSGGKPVALARWDAGDLRPVRVLHI
jgi:tRNA pseudouridine55 synthase